MTLEPAAKTVWRPATSGARLGATERQIAAPPIRLPGFGQPIVAHCSGRRPMGTTQEHAAGSTHARRNPGCPGMRRA